MSEMRELAPRSPAEVVELLRKALDDAMDGEVLGAVVMLRFGDRRGYRHETAGVLTFGQLLELTEAWKHAQCTRLFAEAPKEER